MIPYYPRSVVLPPLFSGYLTNLRKTGCSGTPVNEKEKLQVTVTKFDQELIKNKQDKQEILKIKTDEKVNLPDRTGEFKSCQTKILPQFHRERAPGNQETSRNLR